MKFLRLPFFDELEESHSILLAGAGGGFDIYSGLPLYFALRSAGKKVYLANLSFADLFGSSGRQHTEALVEVTATTTGNQQYFPELVLCRWLESQEMAASIYCFDNTGVLPLLEGYQFLTKELELDTVILIDGGTDSLMRGDESGLGTPVEDMSSIAAVNQLEVQRKMLVCLGFGVDTYHGVCHAQVLETIADVTQNGGFLGAWSLTRDMPEIQLYQQAVAASERAMRHHPSIVCSSISSALDGQFGDYHTSYRTQNSQLFINSLMTFYWCFRLEAIAQRVLYLDALKNTHTHHDVGHAIEAFRHKVRGTRKWQDLPM